MPSATSTRAAGSGARAGRGKERKERAPSANAFSDWRSGALTGFGILLARATTKGRNAEAVDTEPTGPPKAPARRRVAPKTSAGTVRSSTALASVQQHISNASTAQSVELDGKSFFIVGTCPFARRSIDDARTAVRDVRPDAVVVDYKPVAGQYRLDSAAGTLRFAYSNTLRRGLTGLAEAAVVSYSSAVEDKMGVRWHADKSAAVLEAASLGIPVLSGDVYRDDAAASEAGSIPLIVNLLRGAAIALAALVVGSALKRRGESAEDRRARWGALAAGASAVAASPALVWAAPRAAVALTPRQKLADWLLAEEIQAGNSGDVDEDARRLAWAVAAHPNLPRSARRVLAVVPRRSAKFEAVAAALESGQGASLDARARQLQQAHAAAREA